MLIVDRIWEAVASHGTGEELRTPHAASGFGPSAVLNAAAKTRNDRLVQLFASYDNIPHNHCDT